MEEADAQTAVGDAIEAATANAIAARNHAYVEKLAAIRADKLGDWDAFNAWLRAEYDASDLAEFTFEDEEDLEIYNDFRAKRGS